MRRDQLEHILRAAFGITGAHEFVVIGSQSLLGAVPDLPPELRESMELDVFTLRSSTDADLLDGSIGEGSPFHITFGYYAHGVGIETATLPMGWRERLVPVHTPATGGATGFCLEPHDLAASKIAAGREKDLSFVTAMLRHQLIDAATLRERIEQLEVDRDARERCQQRLGRCTAS